jgi:hypothetical protein
MGMAFGDGDPCASHGACWDALTDEARLQLGDRHHFGSGKSYPSLLGVTAASRRRRLPLPSSSVKRNRVSRVNRLSVATMSSGGSSGGSAAARWRSGMWFRSRTSTTVAGMRSRYRERHRLRSRRSRRLTMYSSSAFHPFYDHCNVRYSTINRAVVGSKSAGPRTMRMAENSGCASLAR